MALSAILGGVGAGVGLLSSLLGGKGKNDQIDDVLEQLKKQRYSEDQIQRRQTDAKRMYGSMVDSMIGAGQYLNSDTARAMQNAKLTGESIKAQLGVRDSMEQYNKQLDLKSAELEGQKVSDWSMFGDGLLSALNTGIQGYTTGEYLDMLNPTPSTESISNDAINNSAKAVQPVDRSLIDRDLEAFTNAPMNNAPMNEVNFPLYGPQAKPDYSKRMKTPFDNWTPPLKQAVVAPPQQFLNQNIVEIQDSITSNQLPTDRVTPSFMPSMSNLIRNFYESEPEDGLYPYSERPRQSAEDRNNFLTDYRKRELAKGIRTPRNPNYQRFLRW